jgi:hypothetical protein
VAPAHHDKRIRYSVVTDSHDNKTAVPLPFILLILFLTGTLGIVLSFVFRVIGWGVVIFLVLALLGGVMAWSENVKTRATLRRETRVQTRIRRQLGYGTAETARDPPSETKEREANRRRELGYDGPD